MVIMLGILPYARYLVECKSGGKTLIQDMLSSKDKEERK